LAKGKAVASRQGNKKQNEWTEDLVNRLGMVAAANGLRPRPKWRSDSNSNLVGEGNQGISSSYYFFLAANVPGTASRYANVLQIFFFRVDQI
jgi:hypothetical protein